LQLNLYKFLLSFLSFLVDPVCKLPKKIGRCKASFPRFYFDTNRWQCEIFFYGGCGGNANNFLTEDDCSNTSQVFRTV
uniref:BPTI/Kunitz inhibitor domain-containing protein n=1 Tax=Anolis carolinensis TaxID=28377 RepID=A0A803TJA9_ANOCA